MTLLDEIASLPFPEQPCPFCGGNIIEFDHEIAVGFSNGYCAECKRELPLVETESECST
jgi:hypothetical protein